MYESLSVCLCLCAYLRVVCVLRRNSCLYWWGHMKCVLLMCEALLFLESSHVDAHDTSVPPLAGRREARAEARASEGSFDALTPRAPPLQ